MSSYTISPVWGAGAQLFDNSGNVLTGGKIETYEAGTTTNAVTYTDPIGSVFNSNPIIADASGRLSNEIWLSVGTSYKFVLKDANNVLIATYDNIPSSPQPPIVNDASSISYEQGYTVTAGAFTVGATYLITSVGTTNFVGIGAAANVTGILFTATGVGSGNGTAEYSRTVQTKLQESVSVKDFGAVGNGVTDDTVAVQAAFTACAASGQGLYFPAGTYNAASALTMGSHDLNMEGTLQYTGSAAITFLKINANEKNITVRVRNASFENPTSWSNEALVGVLVYGDRNTINLQSVFGFAVGAQFGVLGAFSGNIVNCNTLYHNKIGLDLKNTDVFSYVNQNTFIGGSINIFSYLTAFNSISRYAVRITSVGTYRNNNNVFYNCSFELKAAQVTGGAEVCPILMERGRANAFHLCRSEDASSAGVGSAIESNDSYGNYYYFAYCDVNAQNITYRGDFQTSYITNLLYTFGTQEGMDYLVYSSRSVISRANYYNGSTSVSIDELQGQLSSASTPVIAVAATLNSDNVQISSLSSFGFFVEVGSATRFKINVNSASTGTSRIFIAAFDSTGTRLTNVSPNHPYITGTPTFTINYFAAFGGAYRIDANSLECIFSIANSDVATIQIIIAGGSAGADLYLQSFNVLANAPTRVYTSVQQIANKQRIGTTVPSAGTWAVGDTIFDAAPVAGGTIGWVCVTAGTPGTWKTFGAIAA
jgi:hypothetical protein